MKTEAPTSPYTESDDRDLRSNKYFVLYILGLMNPFNYMDRNLFSILLEQIKAVLQFTDSQLSVLGGSFMLYTYGSEVMFHEHLIAISEQYLSTNLLY